MKAIILARVSDKKQDSNEAQVIRISDYVKYKGLIIWKTFEIEESSTKGDRDKFQVVIKEIKRSKEQIALVVDTVDRLQRSFKESVLLDDLRKDGKLTIHFYRENLIIHKDSNSADLLRWDMAVMFARSYVLQLSDNVKRKFEQKRRNGEWVGKAPTGYLNVGTEINKKDIVPDPATIEAIRRIFTLYSTGNYSLQKIREQMASEGFRGDYDKPIARSMIFKILTNPFYYGEMLSKGKLYPHKYMPLISRQLFDRCQAVRLNWGKKPFQYMAKPFIFRGLLRCAKCGCSMSPEIKKGKYVYYSCTNARRAICNKRIYIPENDLLKPIYKILGALNDIPQGTIDEIVQGLMESTENKNQYHSEAIIALRQEYDAMHTRIQRLTELLIDGSLTTEVYEAKLKEYKDKQRGINLQIEDHTNGDEKYHLVASTLLNLAKNALQLFESSEPTEKRSLLNFILQNSVVEGKKPVFTLRKPFDTLVSTHKLYLKLQLEDTLRITNWAGIRESLREFILTLTSREKHRVPPLLEKQLQEYLEAA